MLSLVFLGLFGMLLAIAGVLAAAWASKGYYDPGDPYACQSSLDNVTVAFRVWMGAFFVLSAVVFAIGL